MAQRVADSPAVGAPHIAGGPTSVSRRWFLRIAVLGSMAAVLAQSIGCFVHFYYPNRVGNFGGKVLAGKPEDFKLGEPKYVRDGKFYLSRVPDGLLALYQKCPHLGCVVPWRPDDPTMDTIEPKGRFNCPCHGSIYDRYGQIIRGPAPRPMDIFPVTIDGNKVRVKTGTATQRVKADHQKDPVKA